MTIQTYRTSKTRAAVNKGYGMVKVHPEYLMAGPYGTLKTRHASRGGKRIRPCRLRGRGYESAALVGGTSPLMGWGYENAALSGCGYENAALSGCGYENAALSGCGYENAALSGYGIFSNIVDLVKSLFSTLGSDGADLIQKLSAKLNTSVTELCKDPDKLVKMLKKVAPSVAKTTQSFYKGAKALYQARKQPLSPEDQEKEQMRSHLAWLKANDPVSYQRVYKQLQQKAWQQYQQRMYGQYETIEPPDAVEIPHAPYQQQYSTKVIRPTRPMPAYTQDYSNVLEPAVKARPAKRVLY